jgi:site-specific DNA-methyltransferase (adenine-specific)
MLTIINGDSTEELKKLKTNSIDSIICDPPYGISIAGKDWDKNIPTGSVWEECFRVLKPGGFICAMSGARLYHRLAINLENTGFITHQMMIWAYASGMPKGMCLARAIDQKMEKVVPDEKFRHYLRGALKKKNVSASSIEKKLNIKGMFSHYLGQSQPQFPSPKVWKKLKTLLELDNTYDQIIEKGSVRKNKKNSTSFLSGLKKDFSGYQPKSIMAKQWHGYRYGLQVLKPCIEPIYVGQKPLQNNVVGNIIKFNTGAININESNNDRYPANFFHDEALGIKKLLNKGTNYFEGFTNNENLHYYSKAKKDQFNTHPTVKPLKLMEKIVKLYTPKNGIVLDPFMGSGTTGVAALMNSFKFIGIEKETDYFNIAKRRLSLNDVI